MKLQQLPQGCSFNRPKAPAVMIVKQFLGFFRAEALDHTYNVLRLTLYVNRYWRAGLEQVFRLLYCFFVIEHERRRILHFNVTRHPTAEWSDKLHARQTHPRRCHILCTGRHGQTRFWLRTATPITVNSMPGGRPWPPCSKT